MRIAFLAWRDLAHPLAGGSEVLIDRLARGCQDRGHEVVLLCGGPTATRPYPVVNLGGTYTQYVRAPWAARPFRDADVVVDVENGIPFFSPLWRRDRPIVCLVHHVHGPQWRQRFAPPVATVGSWLEGRAMPRVYRRAGFIAPSPSTIAALAALGVPGERITLVPNGIDLPELDPPRAPAEDEPLFLALGRLVPHKRYDLLLRAWEVVRPQVGGRLVLAGDGPELERLQALAGPGATLLGHVSEAQKAQLLREATLLLHPAQHEGWGIVTLEAGAVGTPTLGFDVPGVRDAVRDGETGILVDSEAAFAQAWIALAGDPQRCRELGAGAREWAARFSWAGTIDRFESVLEAAVA